MSITENVAIGESTRGKLEFYNSSKLNEFDLFEKNHTWREFSVNFCHSDKKLKSRGIVFLYFI